MKSNTKKLLRISGVKIRDFARIESCDIKLAKTGVIAVRGKNKQGKTTLLEALNASTRGGKYVPADPIRHGAESGEIELELSQLGEEGETIEIRRRFLPSGSSPLKVSSGGMSGNQTFLDGLVGHLRDPLAFLAQTEKQQVDQIFEMVDLGDFDLDENARRLTEALEDRRVAKREADTLSKSIQEDEKAIEDFDPETAEDSAEILAQYELAVETRAAADAIAKDAAAITAEAEKVKGEIEARDQKIRMLQEENEKASKEHSDLVDEYLEKKKEHEEKLAEAPDFEEISKRKEAAAENDEKFRVYRNVEEKRAQLAKKAEAVAIEERGVSELRKQREDALAAANWPVEGMGYDPDGKTLTLRGSRWDQASDGERFFAAVEIAIAQPSELRVLWLKNGSLLDSEHLAKLDEILVANDYQAFVELVDDGPGEDGLYVHDGQVAAVGEESAEEGESE